MLIFNKQLKWLDYIEVFLCYGKNRRKKDFFCLSITMTHNELKRMKSSKKIEKNGYENDISFNNQLSFECAQFVEIVLSYLTQLNAK